MQSFHPGKKYWQKNDLMFNSNFELKILQSYVPSFKKQTRTINITSVGTNLAWLGTVHDNDSYGLPSVILQHLHHPLHPSHTLHYVHLHRYTDSIQLKQ